MAKFTVRVELHHADDDDYETLHSAMKSEGFSRFIKSNNGRYHLPTAEYNREGNLTKKEVLDSAISAAAETEKTASILVTKSAGRTWEGLTRA